MAQQERSAKLTDEALVRAYMEQLDHPLIPEIQALRTIIKQTSSKISERIKWNAPSYYYREDLVTFGPPARKPGEILLVFHHPWIVNIASEMLQGKYKDRRLAIFKSLTEINTNENELGRIINELIQHIDNQD